MATTPPSPPQRVCQPLPISGEILTIARFHETTPSQITTNNMDLFPANKTSPTSASSPFAPLPLPSPCKALPENPVHPARTSLLLSEVTPEDKSPNAFPHHLRSLQLCSLPPSQYKTLHQTSVTEVPCSSAPQFQYSSPSFEVLPTIFDFVSHFHLLQSKPSSQNFSSQICPTGHQSPPASCIFSHDTNTPPAQPSNTLCHPTPT